MESIAASGGPTSEATLRKVVLIRKLPNQKQPLVAELDGENCTQQMILNVIAEGTKAGGDEA